MTQPSTGRFEFDRAERLADGVIHGTGVLLGVAGVVVLLAKAPGSMGVLIPATIYGIALLAVLTISAVYNMLPASPLKWLLRRFDHSAIYLLIAGTYTPFLVQLAESPVARVLIVAIWAAALVGVAIKVMWPGRFDRLSIWLYLAIGWSGVALWESLGRLPAATLWLLAAGGLLYSLGVIFHVWQSLRFQNAIWHAFVLLASACHYGAVFVMTTAA
ncbi:hemolysin III family protein [Bosea sp. AAP35]|uniref:PAQR family membrane homeostasis protein TrhA n=1 Tax=Bosea sp. AAP35 TaxID=1523417 RepID=UPI000A69FD78|nr:hemolysin III family protein [Bosea sp. AAP35]